MNGIIGTIPCELFGGPLDGAEYGDLPDIGETYTNCELSSPLGQPADLHPRAVYVCRGEAPVHGFWQFFYDRTDYPAALEAVDLPIPHPERLLPNVAVWDLPAGWNIGIQVTLARGIATIAHKGQVDKAGAPYLTHAARVASHFDPVERPLEHCAAWLHDVIEDTTVDSDDLKAAGIHSDVIEIVVTLTRAPDMASSEYIRRIAADAFARAVKQADLADNTDPRRTRHLDPATRARLAEKYDRARRALGKESVEV